jgi:L-seryl-tRNA(Ser) seleniumtransferase
MTSLRELPSVDHILNSPIGCKWVAAFGRPLTLEAIRSSLSEARSQFTEGKSLPGRDELEAQIAQTLEHWTISPLVPVINATGVILHTNLGRAPLSHAALQAAWSASLGYSNLEFDLQTGKRGSRSVHTESLIQRLTGAEAALVVNNNAAAVLLALTSLARRRGVVIARSQLVEIGGGFRVPDVMKQSGAHLLEIGTTNRVHLADFENALEQKPALILRAHRSNFRIVGFTSEPELKEIADLSHQAGIPLVDDLGSGALLDTTRYGLGYEPMVQDSLAAGADLVCFSGDKLLGGPQAGIIAGRKILVDRLKKHPLARAVRADKLCLAALAATLIHYLKDEAESKIPIWQMISATVDQLQYRLEGWLPRLGQGEIISGESTIGGGSLPGETLPTRLLAISSPNPTQLVSRLRSLDPPIIARLQDNRVFFDPRTVLPEQDETLLMNLQRVLG